MKKNNYFPMPNEIFCLGLNSGEIAVYTYLMSCEDRKTFQCYPSYNTIGNALKMSKKTVMKYVKSLEDKRLITTEHTTVTLKSSQKQNGNLRYTIRRCKHIRFHDLRHTFATTALANGMDIKTLSAIIGHNSAETTLNIYTHITDEMQRTAANIIEQGIMQNTSFSNQGKKVPDKTVKTTCEAKFEPVKPTRRKSGTGCISKINDNLYEGRYSPRLSNGKRISKNVYAKTEEECEIKLAELIKTMKAEIVEN